jgi:hypothetical protein
MDPGRLRSDSPRSPVGKVTDEILNTSRAPRAASRQPPLVARFPARVASGSGLARSLRKQSGERSHTMIAATAFAVVGLVVVAFLNRIP